MYFVLYLIFHIFNAVTDLKIHCMRHRYTQHAPFMRLYLIQTNTNNTDKNRFQTYGYTHAIHTTHTHTLSFCDGRVSRVVCHTTRPCPHTHAGCQEHDWHIWHIIFLSYTHIHHAIFHHQNANSVTPHAVAVISCTYETFQIQPARIFKTQFKNMLTSAVTSIRETSLQSRWKRALQCFCLRAVPREFDWSTRRQRARTRISILVRRFCVYSMIHFHPSQIRCQSFNHLFLKRVVKTEVTLLWQFVFDSAADKKENEFWEVIARVLYVLLNISVPMGSSQWHSGL